MDCRAFERSEINACCGQHVIHIGMKAVLLLLIQTVITQQDSSVNLVTSVGNGIIKMAIIRDLVRNNLKPLMLLGLLRKAKVRRDRQFLPNVSSFT